MSKDYKNHTASFNKIKDLALLMAKKSGSLVDCINEIVQICNSFTNQQKEESVAVDKQEIVQVEEKQEVVVEITEKERQKASKVEEEIAKLAAKGLI